MATKKKNDPLPFSNINTNNINVNVNVDPPKSAKEDKPNWVVRALVLGLISLLVSIASAIYINSNNEEKNNLLIKEDNVPSIPANKAN